MTARLGFDDATVFTVPCTWLPDAGRGTERRLLTIERSAVDATRWYWTASAGKLYGRSDVFLTPEGWSSGRRGQRLYPSPQEAFDAAWATDEIGPP